MNSPNDKKAWIGSLVISDQTARQIGWVKEVRFNPDDSNERVIVVVPVPVAWLPKSVTGTCEFSSAAVVGSGGSCLIVDDQADIKFTDQSNVASSLIESIQLVAKLPTVTFQLLLISLLLPSIGALRLVKSAIAKFSRKKSSTSSRRSGDDEGNAGFSPVRQPRPPGPQPTDYVALELPLLDSEKDVDAHPVMRLQ